MIKIVRQYYGDTFVVIVLLAVTLLFVPFHLRPDNFIVDDGYFYPQIARNIALGYGSTFNRVMPTNGYHPLWMMFCVVGALITTSSSHLIQILALMQDGFILISVLAVMYIGASSKKIGVVAGLSVILFMTTTLGITRMLEADLAFAIQLILLAYTLNFPKQIETFTRPVAFFSGALLGITLLARLDLIFFVGVVYLYWILCIYRRDIELKIRAIYSLIVTSGTCLTVFPYLLWNYHYFKHFEPISGAIKSTFPHAQTPLHFPLFSYPVIVACIANTILFFRNKHSSYMKLAFIASVGALLHLLFSVAYGSLAPWYLTTGYISVAMLAIIVFETFLHPFKNLERVAIVAGILVFCVMLALSGLRLFSNFTYTRLVNRDVSFKSNYVEPKRALAEYLAHTLPAGTRIYTYDAPGGVAFYSGMSIIPIDGLVCDYTYNKELLSQGVSQYMHTNHIDYIIAPDLKQGQIYDNGVLISRRVNGGQAFYIVAPLYHQSAGTFIIPDSDLVSKFKTVNPNSEKIFPTVALWKIQH